MFQDSKEENKLHRKKQKDCVHQGTTASENAFDLGNNTCKRDGTSSKCGPKSIGFKSSPLPTNGNIDSRSRKSEGNCSYIYVCPMHN